MRLARNAVREPPRAAREPLVTVVIATYNWSNVLRHAVHSVLWQTHRNLELLVIGDGCTDDSGEVVASFGDPRARWINLPENVGSQAGPNNLALELARGEYFAYLGHDDVWHPKHLATGVAAIEAGSADMVWSVAEVLGPKGTRTRRLSGLSATGAREMGNWIPPCTILHRTEMGRRIGGWGDWRRLAAPVDVEFIDRAQASGARMLGVPSLTAFKFPATARPRSYVERPSHEQAEYLRRIATRRWFVAGELARALARQVSPLPERPHTDPAALQPGEPGELTRRLRRIRGLE